MLPRMPKLPDRKMLSSAAVVGAILVGGVAVAATASAGFLQGKRLESRVSTASPSPKPAPSSSELLPPGVVAHDLNGDPGETASYWTDDQMGSAKPMPIPEIKISVIDPPH